MGVRVEQEREFFDEHYRRLLSYPDHALVSDLAAFRRFLDDPGHPFYERRRLYAAALARLLEEPVAGLKVLDYGCGPGDWGVMLATLGATVTLLDLSPAAVELGLRRARANGVADRVRGVACDASNLNCFADGEFDLIFAAAALHHTLKYPNTLQELARVLRVCGRLVLAETYGNNPLLNLARRLRARWSREPAEQGEEILFGDREVVQLRRHFRIVEVQPLNLLAMAKRLFRGRFDNPAVRAALRMLEKADNVLLRALPWLRRYCGEVVIVAVK
ncbi:MAG: class I SAM-dependent methyltransferase [Bryobacterales bacterium]|nr:class I SAM-dependent methyltransferase [Bryobacteraceae bacterium]MDW8354125.1 class I SAM-dependent methyltransferase [Bryobacterales bacterium]